MSLDLQIAALSSGDPYGQTYEQACQRASRLARRRGTYAYVVNAGDGEFAAADEDELETFYCGASVVLAFDPEGCVCDD